MTSKQHDLNCHQRQVAGHFLAWFLVPLLLAAVCAGCNPEARVARDAQAVSAADAPLDPVGTYSLAMVDGKQVPCTVQHDGHTMTIDSGRFVINADGTCSSRIAVAGRPAAIEVKANYTREGNKLAMKWQGAGQTSGTIDGDTFTMNNEGMVFIYRKQAGGGPN